MRSKARERGCLAVDCMGCTDSECSPRAGEPSEEQEDGPVGRDTPGGTTIEDVFHATRRENPPIALIRVEFPPDSGNLIGAMLVVTRPRDFDKLREFVKELTEE